MKGYLRVASVFPNIKLGDIDFNVQNILDEINKLANYNIKVALFSELNITGVSLGDLFLDEGILDKSLKGLFSIIDATKNYDMLISVGLPFKHNNCIYDVVAIIKTGNILGIVPKIDFSYDKVLAKSQFMSTTDFIYENIVLKDKFRNIEYNTLFSNDIIFSCDNYDGLTFSIDFELNKNKNSMVVLNPNTQFESAFLYNISLQYKVYSEINNCALITSSPSYTESTTNYIFNSKAYIYECGELLAKNHTISSKSIVIDIDIDKLFAMNVNKKIDNYELPLASFSFNESDYQNVEQEVYRFYKKMPYINKDLDSYAFAMHIIDMLTIGLLNRVKNINAKTLVLGLSGGLDSTFALLVCKNVINKDENLNLTLKTVTMPCFGTTDNSLNNVKQLAVSLGLDIVNIDITEAVKNHLISISHDINIHNNTYENAQARERTKVLMDIANDTNGIVVGTSDLSEIALGFSTYNGDHMSMYNVNGSVFKTMIRYILKSIADKNSEPGKNILLSNVLNNILNTAISPELLPVYNNEQLQKTENILGDYILHDFYLYNYLMYHYDIDKMYDLAIRTFIYDDENTKYSEADIKNSLNIFFERFFKSQYKRNSSPDSPSIGIVNLDSHNNFMTVSDLYIKKNI